MRYFAGVVRAVLASVASQFARPTVVGSLYVLALAARAGTRRIVDDQTGGHDAEKLTAFVLGAYGGEITRIAIAIVAAAIVIGALVGLTAGLILAARDRVAGKRDRSAASRALVVLALTACLHATLELWAMAKNPQLYAEGFYARGGLSRTIQVLATDVLGTTGIAALSLLAIAIFIAGSPMRWPEVASRVPALLARVRGNAPSAGAAVGAILLLALGLRRGEAIAQPKPPPRPNVIVIAADSLRADRIKPQTAPAISALADRATRFERAYVSLPRTFPSWVSILSGRHPHHHGIRSMFPRWEERAKDFDALPSRLAKAGYATGVVSDYAGDIFGRINLGFGVVDVPAFDFRQIVRQRALERETPLLPILHSRLGRRAFPVLRELNDAADPFMLTSDAASAIHRLKDKPFFLTVFYSTAHFPYAAPAPYYARFTDPAYRGRFKYHKPVGLGKEAPPDAADIRQVQALYDGAVLAIDDAVKELLDALKREGVADNTIVIVTADHGETLFDNDHGQGHGDHLFGDEGTHVPLVVFDPRHASARKVSQIARDVDIAPTLYELTGVDRPADLDGRSLAPALDGKPLEPALAYAETGLWFNEEIPGLAPKLRLPYPSVAKFTEIDAQHGDEVVLQKSYFALTVVAKHRMVRDERYKLVYAPTRSGVKYMLFDTEADPAEKNDIAAAHADIVARLKGELWTWLLKDVQMAERGGYLVPRDIASLVESAEAGLRLGDVKDGPHGGEGMP
jgi:arylsulfatase A-like enzyme